MDDEKRWQDMNADEQAKRITELAGALNHQLHRIEALEAKIKARGNEGTGEKASWAIG
jgi:hypothetical protein